MSKILSKTEKREHPSPRFFAEIEREGAGCALTASGIVAVSEFSAEAVGLVCREGRIRVVGERLSIVTYENRCAEIRGRILGVALSYGKN